MKFSTLLGVALAMGMSPATLWAAEPGTINDPANSAAQPYEAQKPVANDRNRDYANERNNNDRVTPTGLVRASELMSKAVYNNADEQVGVINDVVLDTNSGQIKYVALSTGGFLGLGDELHAVPWKAFKSQQQDGEKVCVLNFSTEKLEEAEGFDQNNWPNMADKSWSMKNDRQYQSDTRSGVQR